MADLDFNRRFGGMARLYGVAGFARIRRAHVVVVGIGGVGSWAVESLARSGVGRLTLVDLDHIAESNINRQIHALDATVGQAKVVAMRERIAQINPACKVKCIEEFVDNRNWPAVLRQNFDGAMARESLDEGDPVEFREIDAVIDACDQVRAKTAMAAWAIRSKVPFVSVGAAGGKRHAHWVDIDDLVYTTHDPLLAQLRYRLRKEHGAAKNGKKMGVACVFSKEAVAAPDASCAVEDPIEGLNETTIDDAATGPDSPTSPMPDNTLNCHGYGSVVSVTASFGHCAAGWVLERLSQAGPT